MYAREDIGFVLNENYSFSNRSVDLYQKKEYDTRIFFSYGTITGKNGRGSCSLGQMKAQIVAA
jgi:hypothetical protein